MVELNKEEIWMEVKSLWSSNIFNEFVREYTFESGKYHVSNMGRFKRDGVISNVKEDSVGTYVYSLGGKRFKLHQIVLQTFHPEGIVDGNSPDHIDRNNRKDNSLENLRWATRQVQVTNRENKEYKYKKVKCENNNVVYNSCQDAEEALCLVKNTVSRVARGGRKSIHGYTFSYV